jgi:hypothetical protein
LFLLAFAITFAQEEKEETKKDTLTIGVDLMSRYIFRGTELGGASPSIQPSLEYSRGKFTVGLWGAYSTNPTGSQEADLYVSYAITKNIGITVTDYFFP